MNQHLRLSTGETAGFLEMGNPRGEACFFFHGFPGSSRQIQVIRDLSALEKFRVIAVDRPGFGLSSFRRHRRNADIVVLIEELSRHLNIDRFHLVAVSGGSPPAFVVADRLRSRVLSLTSICGLGPLKESEFFGLMGPVGRLFLWLGWLSPFLASKLLARAHAQVQRDDKPDREKMLRWFPPEDVDLLMHPELSQVFRESMLHAFHQGAYGPALELRALQQDWGVQDWGFPFPVYLWHGLKDRIVPPEHSRRLSSRIPNSKLHLLPEEGHYSLPIMRIDEILAPLLTSSSRHPSKNGF